MTATRGRVILPGDASHSRIRDQKDLSSIPVRIIYSKLVASYKVIKQKRTSYVIARGGE